jgi:tetratricopeptide (TPR) repeat protein
MSPEAASGLQLELRRLGESARIEDCAGHPLTAWLEHPARGSRGALIQHLIECPACGALLATAVRAAPATDLPPSAACTAMARQALGRHAAAPRRWHLVLAGLAAASALVALAPLVGRLLLEASVRAVQSATLVSPTPLRLGPGDRPGADTLRAGPTARLSSPALERATVLLRAAELVRADPAAVVQLRARIALLQGEPQRAAAMLRPFVQAHPRAAQAYAHLAAAELHLGRRAAARTAAEHLRDLLPEASWALYDLALLSEPERGAELFARALERETDPRWRREIERVRAALAP